jgi:polyisoprenoid-binding protein YceI
MSERASAIVAGSRRRNWLIAGAAVVLAAAVAGGGYGLWYMFLRPAGPASVTEASLAPVPSAAAAQQPLAGGVDGTWKVDTSIGSFADNTSSFVGYRVQEQLATIGGNVAVGRTPDVSGTLTISGTKLTAATITADLTTLQSDDSRRDGQLRRQGIETGTYPTATFTLTSPVEVASMPAEGQVVNVTATGNLTLHGVTKEIQIPLAARLTGSVAEVTGSLPIVFADYNIQKPSSFIVLSIADQGTLELQLFLTKS